MSLIIGIGIVLVIVAVVLYYVFKSPSCQESEKLDEKTKKCVSKCAEDETWNTKLKECKSNCPESEQWKVDTKTCVPKCPESEKWDQDTKACVSKCNETKTWDSDTQTCKAKCVDEQTWNAETKECVSKCQESETWNAETNACATKCQESETWDAETKACKSNCKEGEMWQNSTCKRKYYPCRYIKLIARDDKTPISFGDLHAYDTSGINVAKNKPTTSSAGSSQLGNDETVKTYLFIGASGRNWWQVDLGKTYNISLIKLRRRVDNINLATREDGAKIQCLAEDMTIVKELTVPPVPKGSQVNEFNFDETVKETFANAFSPDNVFLPGYDN